MSETKQKGKNCGSSIKFCFHRPKSFWGKIGIDLIRPFLTEKKLYINSY